MEPDDHGPHEERAADPRPEGLPDEDSIDTGLMAYFGRPGTASGGDGPTFPRAYGDYELLREIGRGAMGTVYLAEQTALHRRVALKILQPAMSLRFDAVVRFRTEAASAARLHHPGLVQVYAFGRHEDDYHLAMELVAGSTLQAVIAELRADGGEPDPARIRSTVAAAARVLGVEASAAGSTADGAAEAKPWDRPYVEVACRLITQVADALQQVHDAGIIHRDVKPSNILVREDGTAVLTDFGLARVADQPGVTRSSAYLGTPMYSSPEQAGRKNDQVDHRSDIFSLGVVLYELLTLRHPFAAESTQEVLDKVVQHDPPDPRSLNRRVPRDLVTILQKALQKDPRLRYANAAALAADLRAFLAEAPIAARRVALMAKAVRFARRHRAVCAVCATVVLCGAAFAGWWWTRPAYFEFVGDIDDVTVRIDGEVRGATPIDGPIRVDPGPHDICFEREGERKELDPISVERGDSHPVVVLDPVMLAPVSGPGSRRGASGSQPDPGEGGGMSPGELEELVNRLSQRVSALLDEAFADPGGVDLGKLDAARASIIALTSETTDAKGVVPLGARFEARGHLQRAVLLLNGRFLRLLMTYVDLEADPAPFDELRLGLLRVAETVAEGDPDGDWYQDYLENWADQLATAKALIVLLQEAEAAYEARNKKELRRAVADMRDRDAACGLTRKASGLLAALFVEEDRGVDSVLSEFRDPDGSLESFQAAVAKLCAPGDLDEEHVRALATVRAWWEEIERTRSALATMTEEQLRAVRLPAVDELPDGLGLRERGEELRRELDDLVVVEHRLRTARGLQAEIEAALRDRRLEVATDRLAALSALAVPLDFAGLTGRVETLARQEAQWDAAERGYAECRALLARGSEEAANRHAELVQQWLEIRVWLDRALDRAIAGDRRRLLQRRCALLLRLGDYEKVLGAADELLGGGGEGEPGLRDRFAAQLFRGQANYLLTRFEAAEGDFTLAIGFAADLAGSATPAAERAHYWRAACRYARSQRETATKARWLERALEEDLEHCDPSLVDSKYLWASSLILLDRPAEAVAHAEAAVRAHDLDDRAFSEDEILAAFRKDVDIVDAVRSFWCDVHYKCGEAYRGSELYADGIREYGRSLEYDDRFALSYFGRGACYASLKNYPVALGEFQAAIEHSGDNAELKAKATGCWRYYKRRR